MSSRDRVVATGAPSPRARLVQGVVSGVHDGRDGFVSTSLHAAIENIPKGTHVTFSLRDWRGKSLPRVGQMVALEEITLFDKGWRALCAKPIGIDGDMDQRGEQR